MKKSVACSTLQYVELLSLTSDYRVNVGEIEAVFLTSDCRVKMGETRPHFEKPKLLSLENRQPSMSSIAYFFKSVKPRGDCAR